MYLLMARLCKITLIHYDLCNNKVVTLIVIPESGIINAIIFKIFKNKIEEASSKPLTFLRGPGPLRPLPW